MPEVEVIRGREYHRGLILIARRAMASDHKAITPGDADAMFEIVEPSYGSLEKATILYIRKKFMWSPEGDERFREMVRSKGVQKRKQTLMSKSTAQEPPADTGRTGCPPPSESPASPQSARP